MSDEFKREMRNWSKRGKRLAQFLGTTKEGIEEEFVKALPTMYDYLFASAEGSWEGYSVGDVKAIYKFMGDVVLFKKHSQEPTHDMDGGIFHEPEPDQG